MNSSESVSREVLLELARLEALGVLDEVDGERLNRHFHLASAAIQAEIRAVQASICGDESLHSSEMPEARLRGTTLTRIRDEIAAEQAALAPIASIGPRRAGAGASSSEQAIEIVQLRATCETMRGEMARWSRTAVMWRAAAIVLCSLVAVVLYFALASNFYAVRIGQLALDANTREMLRRELGPTYRDFADGGSLVRGFAAVQRGFNGAASVYVHPRDGSAYLVALGLPQEVNYTVRLVGDDGTVTEVGSFTPSDHYATMRVDRKDTREMTFARWEIVDPAGNVVLRT